MKSKLEYLIGYAFKKKIKSKWFKVANILLLVLIPVICNIDSIINFFGGDFDKPVNIYVVDKVNMYERFENEYKSATNLSLSDTKVTVNKSNKTVEEIKKEIKEDETKDILIVTNRNIDNVFDAEIISYDLVDTLLYQGIITSLNNVKSELALEENNISEELLNKVYKPVDVKREILDEEANSNSEFMQLIGSVAVPVFIIPFFFLIIMVIQYVGAEINEEKTSKSMEIIISSVSPTTHFISKIVSTNLFVFLQGFLLLIYGGIGIISRTLITKQNFTASLGTDFQGMYTSFANSGMVENIIKALPFIVILLLLSFVVYSLVAGILASVTTSAEDYQQLQTPLMLILMVGYYLSIMASVYDASLFVKVMSYIPMVSSILSPVLLIQGQIGVMDVIISVLLLLGLIFVLLKYGIKVYKVGILNYSSSKLWKKMANAVKTK